MSGPAVTEIGSAMAQDRTQRRLHPLLRNPLSLVGLVVIGIIVLTAIFAPFLATHDPRAVDLSNRLQPPGAGHYMGTDSAGQDIFSRVVYGSRLALLTGVLVLLLSTVTGVLIGLVAGYFGGRVDAFLMRLTDTLLAFPGLILAMAVVGALGSRSLVIVVIAIALRWWAPYARLMRAQVLSLREEDYVQAAVAAGTPDTRIMLRHILRNGLSPIIVQATLDVGQIILTAAALSFIGLGAQPGEADWGRMVADGRAYIRTHWWVITFPGAAIFLTVLAFNLVGDAVRDHLDPRLRNL